MKTATADVERAAGPGVRQAFGSLATPAFRWWFVSQILSASGGMTQAVGQAWLVLSLTHNGVYLGLMTVCTFAPLTIAGPWAGALVDRADRRRLLIVTQVLFIALAASLTALTAAGLIRVWMVFAFAVATGVVAAADSPARQVYALDLVGTQRLASAVSLYEVVINTSRVLGPAVGGVMLAVLGVSACFAVNAVSFLPPLLVLVLRRPAHAVGPAHAVRPDRPHGRGWRPRRRTTRAVRAGRAARAGQAREGLRYAWGVPAIRVCLLLAAASGMLFSLGSSLPLVATRVFHLGGGGYGLMMSVFGLGALPGAVAAASGRSGSAALDGHLAEE